MEIKYCLKLYSQFIFNFWTERVHKGQIVIAPLGGAMLVFTGMSVKYGM